jgi:hypothetical protein
VSDLEHLVALADMMGGHVRIRRSGRQWHCSAWSDAGVPMAMKAGRTVTAAVLACLAMLREKEGA